MNEHHDTIAARAAELGFQADHAVPVEPVEGGDALFTVVMNNAFSGRPPLVESGVRVLIMATRCFVPLPWLDATTRREMKRISLRCNGGLRVPSSTEARRVFELILGAEQTAWRIGRRASLLAYALNRSVVIREALNSFETIGELWDLSAENKRSAVSAAMNKLRAELVKHGQLPSGFRFWFEKSADARVVYEQAQIGNHNRAGSVPPSSYDAEIVEGLPLKPRFARMSAEQRRAVLREMHEESERRRVERLEMRSAEGGMRNGEGGQCE